RTYLIRYAADLLDLHPLPTRRSSDLLIDPARGRLVVPGGLAAGDAVFAQHYHFGLTHWVGAGPFPHVADLSPDDEVTGELPSGRSEEHTSELQSRESLVCRPLLEKKK